MKVNDPWSHLDRMLIPAIQEHGLHAAEEAGFVHDGLAWHRELNGVKQSVVLGVLPAVPKSRELPNQIVLVVRLLVPKAEPIYYDMLEAKPDERVPYLMAVGLESVDRNVSRERWSFKDQPGTAALLPKVEEALQETVIPFCDRCSTPRGVADWIADDTKFARSAESNPALQKLLGDQLKRIPPSPRPVFGAALLILEGDTEHAAAYLANAYPPGTLGQQLFANAFKYIGTR